MAGIIERVLGANNHEFSSFIDDCIRLTKSIIVKNAAEAKITNDTVENVYGFPTRQQENPSDWRYYQHLSGNYYHLGTIDQPVRLVSLDTGEEIEWTKQTAAEHDRTRQEMLRYERLYDSVVENYPLQETYIRSVSNLTTLSAEQVVSLSDWGIVSYNADLIEPREGDLVATLNRYLSNYAVTWGRNSYVLLDEYFIQAQLAIAHLQLLQKLIALRLKNAKTNKAHSFHIRNYLASHYGLDRFYELYSEKQRYWLYRNLLHLETQSGNNHVFQELTEHMFSARQISLVGYGLHQSPELRQDNLPAYTFRQERLNKKPLLYFQQPFLLPDMVEKETMVAPRNGEVYDRTLASVDDRLTETLDRKLLTKDIETIFIDYADSVKWKLIPTLISNFAQLTKQDQIRFRTSFVDIATNNRFELTSVDCLKFINYLLVQLSCEMPNFFPALPIIHVYKDTPPSLAKLRTFCYNDSYRLRSIAQSFLDVLPNHGVFHSTAKFEAYISQVYRLGIAEWLFLSNRHNLDDQAQLTAMFGFCSFDSFYVFDNETPTVFFDRTGLPTMDSKETAEAALERLLDGMFNSKLKYLFNNKETQEAMVSTMKCFKSYSTQFMTDYFADNSVPIDSGVTRGHVDRVAVVQRYPVDPPLMTLEHKVTARTPFEFSGTADLGVALSMATETKISPPPVTLNIAATAANTPMEAIQSGTVSRAIPVPELQRLTPVNTELPVTEHNLSFLYKLGAMNE